MSLNYPVQFQHMHREQDDLVQSSCIRFGSYMTLCANFYNPEPSRSVGSIKGVLIVYKDKIPLLRSLDISGYLYSV